MSDSSLLNVAVGDREFLLLGTAHVSAESVEQVRAAVRESEPDCVCVELDEKRLASLSDPEGWKKLDLVTVIRRGQFATLLANLFLASYQKRMGLQTGVRPGSELVAAVEEARAKGIPVVLVDREIRTTLRRTWALTPWRRRLKLVVGLLEGVFGEGEEISEDTLAQLREKDTLGAMMDEMGKTFPEVRQVLLAERDEYMVGKVREAAGRRVLVVIGAGHREGMAGFLAEDRAVRPAVELEHVPPPSSLWKLVGWGIPAAVIGSMVWIGVHKGLGALGDNLLFWVLSTGVPAALGTLCALGHPLTILTAFVMAPLKPFHPFLSVGAFAALAQAWFVPPRVEEMESVSDDIGHLKRWWSNRLLRIGLCFVLPGLPTTIGMALGGWHILKGLH
jgi:pheromone shutdown-related protein TraB